jgi:hypothetical protein
MRPQENRQCHKQGISVLEEEKQEKEKDHEKKKKKKRQNGKVIEMHSPKHQH